MQTKKEIRNQLAIAKSNLKGLNTEKIVAGYSYFTGWKDALEYVLRDVREK